MNETSLKKFNNKWYKPASKIKIIFWYFVNMFFLKTSFPWPQVIKRNIIKIFGGKLGTNVLFKSNINVKYPWFLEVGNNVWIGENVWIDNLGKVEIQDNVCLSQGAMLLCGNHDYKKSSFDLIIGDITLEKGSWVGAKSVVCPGVTLKTHSILSVGSIATKDLEPFTIYQGNPAQKVRTRKIDS